MCGSSTNWQVSPRAGSPLAPARDRSDLLAMPTKPADLDAYLASLSTEQRAER
jgi:hypothetical protein